MTSIVAIKCKDGIVIGTDSSTTFSAGQIPTIEQPSSKLEMIGDRIIVAGTGQVGLGQRFCAVIRKALKDDAFKKSAIDVGKHLAKEGIEDFASTRVATGTYGALVAFVAEGQTQLCEFAVQDFQPELKTEKIWYCSMGSGQLITDPFLAFIREIFWNDGIPTVRQAIFAVTWTLDHAIRINPGGINAPIQIGTVESDLKNGFKARLLSSAELDEHREFVEEAKQTLRAFSLEKKDETLATPEIPLAPDQPPK